MPSWLVILVIGFVLGVVVTLFLTWPIARSYGVRDGRFAERQARNAERSTTRRHDYRDDDEVHVLVDTEELTVRTPSVTARPVPTRPPAYAGVAPDVVPTAEPYDVPFRFSGDSDFDGDASTHDIVDLDGLDESKLQEEPR